MTLARELDSWLATCRRGPSAQLHLVRLPAPSTSLEDFLGVHGAVEGPQLLWGPPDGTGYAGVGAAREVVARGPERFAALREAARDRCASTGLLGTAAPTVRYFGGFAFRHRRRHPAPWATFGDARFVLPRLTYERSRDGATLTLALHGSELDSSGDAWVAWLQSIFARLEAPAPVASSRSHEVQGLVEMASDRYGELVEAIRHGIDAGRFEKVVLARRLQLTLDAAPDPLQITRHFASRAPGCTRFAIRFGRETFLGATPEQLVTRHGRRVATEALAGSIRAGAGASASLLGSQKDRSEHGYVVDALRQALTPVCSELTVPDAPDVRSLRHVLHLHTPLRGLLARDEHVVDLVARLHPSPAVGGTPRDSALDWIAANEEDARGWYAGPIGHFDASGDGAFCVALRSGVVDGRHIHGYAGAGIVRDSNAEAEYAETRLKLTPLLEALGTTPENREAVALRAIG